MRDNPDEQDPDEHNQPFDHEPFDHESFDAELRAHGTTEGRMGRKLSFADQCGYLAAMLRDPPVSQALVARASGLNAGAVSLLRGCLARTWANGSHKPANGRYPRVVAEYVKLGATAFHARYYSENHELLTRLKQAWDDVKAGRAPPIDNDPNRINRRARSKCGVHRITSWKHGCVITAEIALRDDGYRYRLEGLVPDESMIWQGRYTGIPGPPFATSGQAWKDVLMRLDPAPNSDDMNWEPSK